jgi:hypothetical protein
VDSGRQVVKAIRQQIHFFRHVRLEWRDTQDAVFQGDIQQLAFRKKLGDYLEAVVKLASALIEVLGRWSYAGWAAGPPGFLGQQVVIERQIVAAPGTQTSPERSPELSSQRTQSS